MSALRTAILALVASEARGEIPSMYGNNEMHQYRKALPAPMNEDVPYLKCPVCQKLAVEAYEQISALVAAQPKARPAKRRFESSSSLGSIEEGSEEVLSKLCDPDNDGHKEYNQEAKSAAGKWIHYLDVQKADRALKLVKQPVGYCRRECRTIEKVCDEVVATLTEDEDVDLAAYLVKAAKEGTSVGMVQQKLCTQMSGVCKKKKVPLWPEGKPRMNEEFKPKTAEDLRQEEMVATMPGENGNGITIMKPGAYDLPGGEPSKIDPIDVLKEEL